MFRAIPVSNKKLSKLWNEMNFNLHIDKLRKIKSRVDIRSPSKFSHLKFKAKNYMIQEQRITEIERENKILLDKMTHIAATQSSKKLPKLSKSLNKGARKRKLVEIAIENQAMMRRIGQKKSNYNHGSWDVQRKKVEKMLVNICEYPYTLGNSQKNFKVCRSPSKQLETPGSSQGLGKVNSSDFMIQKQILLNGEKFLIEIKKSQLGYKISAFKVDKPESYCFDIGIEEAQEIMGGQEDVNKLIGALKMDGDDMILVEYKDQSPLN
ncbi:hypothetical protein SteCoe_24856 [Stentor coeruleus]|uniref:Uncharacterized protein n=1 Tax=Stentor coeruleus TaxID=5963 RepID=A0A1R2BH02_9CILI|nr:hypothetical protein SteCoe_24856 [Stentor coeruleus]